MMRFPAFLFLTLFLATSGYAQPETIKQLLVNKHWQYSNTIRDKNKREIYNFKTISGPKEIVEIALYFSPTGTFKEVVNKATHPKPPRTGTWQVNNDTLVLNFPNQRWNYKIHFMNYREFQCTMSK